MQRTFPIYEQLRLVFRVEAFNIFNHPNLGNPDALAYQTQLSASGSSTKWRNHNQDPAALSTLMGTSPRSNSANFNSNDCADGVRRIRGHGDQEE